MILKVAVQAGSCVTLPERPAGKIPVSGPTLALGGPMDRVEQARQALPSR
jgi:hypothetical protein